MVKKKRKIQNKAHKSAVIKPITALLTDTEKKALRYNTGKRKWSLVHFKSLEPMIEVLEYGAKKYTHTLSSGEVVSGAHNWKKGLVKEELLESMMRHLSALIDGQETDPESGLSHIGHLQCNTMFYNYHFGNKN